VDEEEPKTTELDPRFVDVLLESPEGICSEESVFCFFME